MPKSVALIDEVSRVIGPDDSSLSQWYESYVDSHRDRLAFDVDIVTRHLPEGARLLEIGSVPPLFTGAIKKLGYDVRGVDILPERFASAIDRIGVDVVNCDIESERLPFGDGSFDAVVFFEIFEHLRINPIFTLREMHRVIADDGALLLSTPNLRSLNGLFNFVVRNKSYSCTSDVYAQYEKLELLGHMGHVREYTFREVREFLQKVGFQLTTVIYRGKYQNFLKRLTITLVPQLRPFLTVVAKKAKP